MDAQGGWLSVAQQLDERVGRLHVSHASIWNASLHREHSPFIGVIGFTRVDHRLSYDPEPEAKAAQVDRVKMRETAE
jgi:hypothetical protein